MKPQFSLAVAPMMDRTDRHFRYLIRLISPNARLYTEMITTSALLHGDRGRLLEIDEMEHPVAIQLGGSDPAELAQAATFAESAGFDEVNLNVGCPSDRVKAGKFGVGLMLEPQLVADCVAAMRGASSLPVTVKTRIGVDEHDSYEVLSDLTERLVAAGVSAIIVHARKAWLNGLSPKQNRNVPPLDYERVYRLKRDFEHVPIAINGGFTSEDAVVAQVGRVDGVMLGRAAFHEPMLIGRLDRALNGGAECSTEADVLRRYVGYMWHEIERGTPLSLLTRPLTGMYRNRPGARRWRQKLSGLSGSVQGIEGLLENVGTKVVPSRYNARCVGHRARSDAKGMQA